MAVRTLFVSLILCGCRGAEAGVAFRATSAEMMEGVRRDELMNLLGQGHSGKSDRLEWMEDNIRPMYTALHKNVDGSLSHGMARYALHRFFVQRHGWHVKGLEATGSEKWSDAPVTAMFEGRVPDFVLDLVKVRFNGVKLGLRDLAVLAATLEDLIHSEAIMKLRTAFDAQGVSVDESLTEDLEQRVVNTYMLFHVKPHPNYTKMTSARLNHVLSKASRFLPGWEDTLLWVQDVKREIEYEHLSERNPFDGPSEWHTFDSVARLVEEVGERYGQFQNIECRSLKNSLLDLEDNENGRVRLSKFYAPALDGSAQHFGESPDYLRHLGALDETDPKQPSIIVTNYLYAKSNCLATSGFYSVCCINQCEALMGKLERAISGPVAPPSLIVDLVTDLPSETLVAPRNLSTVLLQRLDEISQRHGGSIPIHGRLFAQWMHHAYPNECPYPHVSGDVDTPLSAAEWRLTSGAGSARASKEDMQSYVTSASDVQEEAIAMVLPWTEHEELVASVVPQPQTPGGNFSTILRVVVLMMALISAAVRLMKMAQTPASCLPMHEKAKQSSSWGLPWQQAQKAHFV